MNGCSKAVRLPSEFRFGQSEVYIRCDEAMDDVALSQKPRTLEHFLGCLMSLALPTRTSCPNVTVRLRPEEIHHQENVSA